ncbi:MAG: hypothetical protein WA020_10060 [Candidatus Acidiferrales bacterium]
MRSSDNPFSPIETEKQLLRFLCASGEDVPARRRIFHQLSEYSWRDRDHRILFESIGELLSSAPRQILAHLPAALTRRGFPDISCDSLAAPGQLDEATALALAEELLRASQ